MLHSPLHIHSPKYSFREFARQPQLYHNLQSYKQETEEIILTIAKHIQTHYRNITIIYWVTNILVPQLLFPTSASLFQHLSHRTPPLSKLSYGRMKPTFTKLLKKAKLNLYHTKSERERACEIT